MWRLGVHISCGTGQAISYRNIHEMAFKPQLKADGQNFLTPEMLENSTARQKSEVVKLDNGLYYVLPHPHYVFEIWRRHDVEHTIIGVSIYD